MFLVFHMLRDFIYDKTVEEEMWFRKGGFLYFSKNKQRFWEEKEDLSGI